MSLVLFTNLYKTIKLCVLDLFNIMLFSNVESIIGPVPVTFQPSLKYDQISVKFAVTVIFRVLIFFFFLSCGNYRSSQTLIHLHQIQGKEGYVHTCAAFNNSS